MSDSGYFGMVDDKDWTWVLVRTCPECGFDAGALPRRQIGSATRTAGARFAELLSGSAVETRPAPDVWSTLEYGCHVVDVFGTIGYRLQLLLTEDNPTFLNWDQDATAVDRAYALQDPAIVAEEIVAGAAQLADAFDAVPDDAWRRPGMRSNGSRFTVETLGQYMVHDIVHHVWDVEYPPSPDGITS